MHFALPKRPINQLNQFNKADNRCQELTVLIYIVFPTLSMHSILPTKSVCRKPSGFGDGGGRSWPIADFTKSVQLGRSKVDFFDIVRVIFVEIDAFFVPLNKNVTTHCYRIEHRTSTHR